MSAIDAVLSYHTNPLTCGVAKFNQQLAEKLGVPLISYARGSKESEYPLVSIKPSEMTWPMCGADRKWLKYDLLLHDRTLDVNSVNVTGATRVFYADELGCPSTLQGNPTRGTLNILTFGMAHKLQAKQLRRLQALLERTDPNYTVSVSTAIHEGSPWDSAFDVSILCLRATFGDHLRVLGFLGDDALAKELRECQAAALFYDPAVRANNTTLWAALDAGTPVITNLDADSPKELQHNVSVFDLAQLTEWPDAAACRVVRAGGAKAAEAYSWDHLLAVLHA